VLSAQRFQEGVEAVARPLEDLAQAIDGHTIGAVGHPAHGGLELLPQDGHMHQARFVFVHLEPLAERPSASRMMAFREDLTRREVSHQSR
jgi:hypothetical protein